MAEGASSDAAAFLAGWLTPTSLFLLLNVIVLAIAAISILGSSSSHRQHHNDTDDVHKQQHNQQQQQRYPLARAPSLFSRVTSFNLHHFHHHQNHEDHLPETEHSSASETSSQTPPAAAAPLQRAPSLLSRLASLDLFVHRSGQSESVKIPPPAESSESVTAGDDVTGNGAREVHVTRTRSEPTKKAVAEEEVRMRTSASEKAVNEEAETAEEEEEVDAKADDFINRFKHQLKLQRLESLLRNRNVNAAVTM